MNKIGYFVSFAVGAAIGTAAAWFYAKKKYEQIAQEEIDSVKEVFSKRGASFVSPEVKEEETTLEETASLINKEKPDIMSYSKKLAEEGYIDYSNVEMSFPDVQVERGVEEFEPPYVISPEEFGEIDNYETISLTYYADHILADDMDEMIEDIEATVSFDALNHFGEYEDDSVFVRNDRRNVDYEILLDNRRFEDVRAGRPYQR